ncbi:MAG: hypothetical protein WCL34_00390 [Methylococcaceae bacterium]
MKLNRMTKTLGLGLLLFTTSAYSVTPTTPVAQNDDDILDLVMPAILAAKQASNVPLVPNANQKLTSFSKLAASVKQPTEIKVSIAHYTDILTPPQIKVGSCTHQHVVTPETKVCDTWNWKLQCTHTHVLTSATYACDTWGPSQKRFMNCDFYAHVQPDFYMLTNNDKASYVTQIIVNDILNYSKAKVTDAVNLTLAESVVSGTTAGLGTSVTGPAAIGVAIGAFVTAFNTTIGPNVGIAKVLIVDHITHGDFVDSISGINAPVTVDSKPACGWGNWSNI